MISPDPPAGPARRTATVAGIDPTGGELLVGAALVDGDTVVVDCAAVGGEVAGGALVVDTLVVDCVAVVVGGVDDESPHEPAVRSANAARHHHPRTADLGIGRCTGPSWSTRCRAAVGLIAASHWATWESGTTARSTPTG